MKTPVPDSYWVVDGLFLAGEYPGSYLEEETRRKLAAFLDAGIRAFFDLTAKGELSPYEERLCELARDRSVDVTYERTPIRDMDVPDVAGLRALLGRIAANIAAGIPSYVHCYGGIGRTGTVVGCWLVEHAALQPDAALKRVTELRFGTPDARFRSPQTDAQVALVRSWQPEPV